MTANENEFLIPLSGRIDSNNAQSVEADIRARAAGRCGSRLVLDAEKLEYVSSAALRVFLRLKKDLGELAIVNACSEVYEILDMTGFTELMQVEKAYRRVSVKGCEQIGRGKKGAVYRVGGDTVVKVYDASETPEDIRREREMAKLAFVLGIPTAISYDVVKVDDCFGSVFELLNARSFSSILADEPERFDWCVNEYSALIKKIHSTAVPGGKLQNIKERVLFWADSLRGVLTEAVFEKLGQLIRAVPDSTNMIHGDYHTKNIMLQGDEVMLIDMDTLAVGDPIFELGQIFNSFIGFYEVDSDSILDFHGFDKALGERFFDAVLRSYVGTDCAAKLNEVRDKARIVGYTRLLSRLKRHSYLDTPNGSLEAALWKKELSELVERTEKLGFSRNELELDAVRENLDSVLGFIEERIAPLEPSPRAGMNIALAAEEIFVNIADYAYAPGPGRALMRVETGEGFVTITFEDRGRAFDPLKKEDPDIDLPAEKRTPGGLGIFLTKKLTDETHYEYRDGKNVFSFTKKL